MFNKPNNNIDEFDFDDIQSAFSKDPKYIYIEESFKCFLVAILHNIEISKKLIKEQHFEGCDKLDAGDLFNGLMIKNYLTNEEYPDEISNKDLLTIAISFKQEIEQVNHLKIYAKDVEPIECLFIYLHYLFIPIRLDANTIPQKIKIQSLKKYISLAISLPFQSIYNIQYEKSINNIELLQQLTEKMITIDGVIERIESLKNDFIKKTIQYNRTDNPTQKFIRLVAHLIIILSIEIIRKYCPNIMECCRINPSYNGTWINLAFDGMYQQQISELMKITENCKTVFD